MSVKKEENGPKFNIEYFLYKYVWKYILRFFFKQTCINQADVRFLFFLKKNLHTNNSYYQIFFAGNVVYNS